MSVRLDYISVDSTRQSATVYLEDGTSYSVSYRGEDLHGVYIIDAMEVSEDEELVGYLRLDEHRRYINRAILRAEDAQRDCPAPEDGWYAVWPEGGGWEAVHIRRGVVCDRVCESEADTHRAADDDYATICDAIVGGRTATVAAELEVRVAAAWKREADPRLCAVERVMEPDVAAEEPSAEGAAEADDVRGESDE